MTDLGALQKEEFLLWVRSLTNTTNALSEQLANTTLTDTASVELLKQVLDDASVDLEEVENFRPTAAAAKKGLSYSWALALEPIAVAKKVIRRAGTLIASHSQTSEQQPMNVANQARRTIPEVKITSFDGDVVAYHSFITAFKLKYDALPITKAEKLQHLKEHVSGDPKTAISKLDLTDANYDRALLDLNTKYDKPDQVVSELYARLETLPISDSSNANLWSTYYELEKVFSSH